jgi:hypothetical protein
VHGPVPTLGVPRVGLRGVREESYNTLRDTSTNVPYRRVGYIGELDTFTKTILKHYSPTNTFLTILVRRVKGSLGTAYALSY